MNVAALLKAKGDMVVTTHPTTPIMMALHRMRLDSLGALVVSSDGDHVVGIISERDVARGLARYGPGLVSMRVADLMTRSVKTCSPQDHLRRVMAQMTRSRIRHLPVLEGGRLCGILSIGDVVKSVLEDMELEINVLRDVSIASRSAASPAYRSGAIL